MKPHDLKPLLMIARFIFARAGARKLKGKGIVAYLKALQAARHGLIGVVSVLLILQTMMISFLGLGTVAVFHFVERPEVRMYILLGFFGAMFLIPLMGLVILFSERTWYQASGAEKMVESYRVQDKEVA